MQVPKIGRKFVKPDDIAFIDETVYAPHIQTKPPYKMKIDSLLPLLGDRVLLLRCSPESAALANAQCVVHGLQRLWCTAATIHVGKDRCSFGIKEAFSRLVSFCLASNLDF